MIYPISLGLALFIVGLLLVVLHGAALWKETKAKEWLKKFPRSKGWGAGLLGLATIWSWLLVANIDLGEFSNWRPRLEVIIPIMAFLTWRYVDEFLAVRALGIVALLAAEPMLEAAWMRPEVTRLPLVVLAYAYIIIALFWIGTPYTLRDQIAWVQKTSVRWRALCYGGLAYGALLLIGSLHRPS